MTLFAPCFILWESQEHCFGFELPGLTLKFWTYKLSGKWRVTPWSYRVALQYSTQCGAALTRPGVTRLSPGGLLSLWVWTWAGFPRHLQVQGDWMWQSRGKNQTGVLVSSQDRDWWRFKRINVKVLHRSGLYSAAFHQSVKGLNLHTNSLCELSCLSSSPEGDMWKMEYLHLNFKFLVLHGNYH